MSIEENHRAPLSLSSHEMHCHAADVVVECSLKWAQEGRSPQMWWVGVGKKESPAYHSMEVGC